MCLTKAVLEIVKVYPEVKEVWLFGSLARGDALPGSDADLFMVLSNTPFSFLDRAVHYRPAECGVGVDVLAYTQQELAQMQITGHTLPKVVKAEGICLYQATE